jgi:Ca2+-binding RTX toxin-like protein
MLFLSERIGRRSLAVTAFGLALLGVTASQASASYSAQVRGETLQVEGDKASDSLTLVLTAPTTLGLDVGDDGTIDLAFDRTTFTAIDVDGGAGDDKITVSRNGGSISDEAITLDGGAGDDTLIGSDGAETLEGGPGNDFIDGNIGADAIFGGNGADTVQWDPGDGSDTVDGDGGKDTLQFNGSNAGEEFDISANGSRVRFSRNVGAITMDLGTLERINLRTLGSVDNVTVGDTLRTPLELVDVDESVFTGEGDAAKDNVIVNGTSGPDRVTATSPTPGSVLVKGLAAKVQVDKAEADRDLVTVNGLAGADTLTSGVDVTGPSAVVFNGGDGTDTDTARYEGSPSDDQIFMANNGTAARIGTQSSAGLDVIGVEETGVQGLDGSDTIQGQNGIVTITHFTIDGGNGDDTLGGGDGDDTLTGGPGNDHVDGNRGVDTANLGDGDDRFQWDPGDGNDFVNGQAGFDGLDFNGSNAGEKIDLFKNGGRARLTRDVAAITMDLDNTEDVVVKTLGSADTVTVDDLRGTGVSNVDVDLSAFGGAGDGSADTVIANGTDRRDIVTARRFDNRVDVSGLPADLHVFGSEPTADALRINTLGGNDDVTVAPEVADLIATTVDLGTGE